MNFSLNCLVVFTALIFFSGSISAKLKPSDEFPINKTFKSKKSVYKFRGDAFPGVDDGFPRVLEYTNENEKQIKEITWISGKLQFKIIDTNLKASENLEIDKPLEAYDKLYSGNREIIKEYIFPKNAFHDDWKNQLLVIWEDGNKAQFRIDEYLDMHKKVEEIIQKENLKEIKSVEDLQPLAAPQKKGITREQYNQQLLQQQQQYYQQMMLMGGGQGFGAQGFGAAGMNPFAQFGMDPSQMNQAQFNPFFQGQQGIDDQKLPYNPFLQQFQPGFQQVPQSNEAPQNNIERLQIEDKFDRIDRF